MRKLQSSLPFILFFVSDVLAVSQPSERQRFSQNVPTAALTVVTGSWKPSAQKPYPEMERLLTAAFWVKDEYAALRNSSRQRRHVPELSVSDDADLAMVMVEGPEHKAEDLPRNIFIFKSAEDVPSDVSKIPVQMVMVEAEAGVQSECPFVGSVPL